MTDEGASVNEVLMAACKNDDEDTVQEILENGDYDLGYTDGVGNTFAHTAARNGSLGALECLVNLDDIDVNVQNHVLQETPLHLAVGYQSNNEEVAAAMVDILLQAGADINIKSRQGMTPSMLVDPKKKEIRDLMVQATAAAQVGDDEIANDDEYGSDDDEASD